MDGGTADAGANSRFRGADYNNGWCDRIRNGYRVDGYYGGRGEAIDNESRCLGRCGITREELNIIDKEVGNLFSIGE